MSNFEIHELTEKAINRNSNIIHDTLYGEDYETGRNLAGVVADLASANVAAPYDSTVTYAIGQYCLYEGDIYRCIAITTGAFDSTAWTQIVVTGEFRRVVELTSAQYTALSSAEKNNGTLYVITDEETTADDIPYSSGVSVADKLDSLSYIKSTSVDSVTGVTWTCKKYNNGELEIYGSKYYTPPTNISFSAWGSLYITVFDMGTYPIAFYAPPTVIGQAQIENVGCLSSTQATSNTTTAPQITCVRGIAGTIDTSFHINLGLYAHGRWKA